MGKTVVRWGALFALVLQLSCSGPYEEDGGGQGAPNVGQLQAAVVMGAAITAVEARPAVTAPAPLPSTTTNQFAPLGFGEVTALGTYRYTIPIEVPDGRAGMAPVLSLVYNSHAGNGVLGVGWSLSGASEITRCDAVVAAGGVRRRIEANAGDNFCLDGQRLVLVSGQNGRVGAEYRTEIESFARVKITVTNDPYPMEWMVEFKDGRTGTYRPHDDDSFAINREVLKADGTVQSTSLVGMIWPMKELRDRAGNTLSWSHTRSPDFGLPSSVQYTGCHSPSCDYEDDRARLDFVYQERSSGDVIEPYVNGMRLRNTKRLSKLVVKVGGLVLREYRLTYRESVATKRTLLDSVTLCDGAGACMPPTTIQYRDQLGQYTVRTSSSVGGTNNFSYSGPLMNSVDMEIVAFDADGDGNDDVMLHERTGGSVIKERVVLADGAGYFTHATDVNWVDSPCGEIVHMAATTPVDLDGDGRSELVHECGEEGYRVLGWNTASGDLREQDVPGLNGKFMPGWPVPSGPAPAAEGILKFGDLDGDGLPDMLAGQTHTDGRWVAQRAIFTPQPGSIPQVSYGTAYTTAIRSIGPGDILVPATKLVSQVTALLDQDGDGHVELTQMDYGAQMRSYTWATPPNVSYFLRDDPANTLLTQSNVLSAEPATGTVWGQMSYNGSVSTRGLWYFADINGDGLKDGLYREELPNGSVVWRQRVNTGAGYLPPVGVGPGEATLIAYKSDLDKVQGTVRAKGIDNGLRIGDMNGDGRDDLVLLHPGGTLPQHASGYPGSTTPARVLYSNGTGFDAPVSLPSYPSGFTRLMDGFPPGNPRFPMSTLADIDGNGIMDLVELVADEPARRRLVTTSVSVAGGIDLMTSVSHNAVAQKTVEYASLTYDGSGVYTEPLATEYPRAAAARRAIVKRHVAIIPGVNRVDQTYTYENGLTDVTGRGFLGFEKMRVRDAASGVTTTHTYDLTPVVEGNFRHYPRIGRPTSIEAGRPGATHDASLVDATGVIPEPRSTWSAVYSGHPLKKRSEVSSWFMDKGDTVSSVVTNTTYDDYENPRTIVTTSTDRLGGTPRAYTRTLTTTFDNNEATWRLGEARKVVERLQANQGANPFQGDVASGDDTVRTTDLYYDSRGLLSMAVREPSATVTANSRLSIQRFVRDAAGLVKERWRFAPTGIACSRDSDCDDGELCHRAVEPSGAFQCYTSRSESFTYDQSGTWVEGITNAAGHTRWALRDPVNGWVYATVDPNNVQVVVTRDGFGREREIVSDIGPPITKTYGAGVVYEDVEDGSKSATFIDGFGRPELFTWVTYENGTGIGKIAYDALGNVISSRYGSSSSPHTDVAVDRFSVLTALGVSTQVMAAQYDTLARPASSTNGTNETSGYSYGSPIGTVTVTDARGFVSTRVHDLRGRIVSLTQRNESGTAFTTTYGYGGDGELSSIRNPENVTERFGRDIIGRPDSWSTGTDNSQGLHSRRWLVTYDGFDDVIRETRDGVVADYVLDALGRPIERVAAGETQTYSWDPENGLGQLGLMTTNAQGGHETEFSYDEFGRVKDRIERFSDGTLLTLGFTFSSLDGRLIQIRYPERLATDRYATPHAVLQAPAANYSYVRGYMNAIRSGAELVWHATKRHPLGMVTESKQYTGGAQALTTTFVYDASTLRMTSQRTSGTNSGRVPFQSFTYHPNGTLLTKTTGSSTETFDYDSSRGFLRSYRRQGGTKLVEANFAYGSQGITAVNTTTSIDSPEWVDSETYTYATTDARRFYHLLTHKAGAAATQSFTYDEANRVREVREGSTVKRRYSWNSFNLPTLVEHFGPNLTRSFVYDALGARVKKRQDADNEVHYVTDLYEGRNLTAQGTKESVFRFVADGQVVAERIHTWGGTTASTRHIFSDPQGSPAFTVVGQTSTQLGFFPYGKRIVIPAGQNFSLLGYTGHRHDDDIGLINMNGRLYDIARRRFLTRDAIPDQPLTTFGTQAYSYVAHNPTNLIDPTGFASNTYQGGNGDSRWHAQSLAEEERARTYCRSTGLCADPLKGFREAGEQSGQAAREAARRASLKGQYDQQWGGDGADLADGPSGGSPNGGDRGNLSPFMGQLGQGMSLAPPNSSAAPSGNMDGAYGGSSPSQGLDARSGAGLLGTLPSGFRCDSLCVATGGGLSPGVGAVTGGAPKAAGAGVTLFARIRAWLGFGPAARGAAPAVLQQISQGRSIQAAVQALNQASATQAQAVQALNQVVANSSRTLVQATLQGQPGSVVLSGVQFVPGGLTKVVVITAEGVSSYGSGVTNLVNGALVVSNFVAQ